MNMSMNVIETSGLGKRYGSTWALRECTLAIPAGHVAAGLDDVHAHVHATPSVPLPAGQGGDCGFMAASVPGGGGGRITRRR